MKKLLIILALVALSSADIQSDSLALHNNERNNYGVPSVTWSTSLAATAQAYAETMASTGTTSHSTNRVNVGENLAWGSGSSISVTSLGDLWIAEKKYYIPGQDFPDVSTTGSWHDVAHYTQLMWELTTEIGCGIAQASSGRYNYVCHYSPQGNIDGEPVYTVGAAPITSSSSSSPSSSSSSSPSSSSSSGSTNSQPTSGTSTSQPSSSSASTSAPNASSSQFITDCLNGHNTERNNYGVPSLVWDSSLASTAQSYAQVMAQTGTTSHSTNRVNVGENLAWGTGRSVTTTFLIDLWLAEKKYYIPGQDFPDVSTTGSWHDVAHYTQMMWEQTTAVGCGIAQANSGRYNLVCHYYVQGNIDGEPVYTVGVSPISSSSSSSSSTGSTSTQPATNTTSTTSPANSTTTAPANTTSTTNTTTTAPANTTSTTNTTTTAPANTSSTTNTTTTTPVQSQFITDSLNAHNNERNSYGVPSLIWNTSLAATAQAYAQVMAQTGTTSHSTGRVNVGENLAWGTGRSVTTTFLIDLWLAEKKYYIPGQDFPDVSTTGSWHDVAHYTAMMWEKTTAVGCGIAQANSGRYNLVCHYYVQGNIDGEPVYTVGVSPISSSSSSPSSSSSSPSSSSSTGSTSTQPATGTTTTTPQTNTTSQPSSSSSSPYTYSTSAPDASSSSFESDSLNAHNTARNAYGVPSLTWSASLAQTAQSYSQVMASTGTTSHSTGRVDVGENLAWQSGSGTTTQALANRWLAEKQYYVAGQDFPNVSTTGNWESVAHYTQMMWRQTTQVGCGVSRSGSGMYYYVCHYYVQGNIDGQPVY